MRRKTAVILGVSGAALALTASSAFTAAGLSGPTSSFIGGSKTVTVNGTTISAITYTASTSDATKTAKIALTFSDQNAEGKTPSITINFPSGSSATAPSNWACSPISSSGASECGAGSTVTGAAGTAFTTTNLESITLTVS